MIDNTADSSKMLIVDNTTHAQSEHAILLFDGVCNTCNAIVNLALKYDLQKQMRFASLQSENGRRIAQENGVDANLLETVVLIYRGKTYLRSEAVLQFFKIIGGPFEFLTAFKIVPLGLRDTLYTAFAKNRYRLFGKKDTCRMPTPDERSRFLD